MSRRLSRIVEDNWDVDETPTTASAIQAKVRKVGLASAHTGGWTPDRLGFGLGLGGKAAQQDGTSRAPSAGRFAPHAAPHRTPHRPARRTAPHASPPATPRRPHPRRPHAAAPARCSCHAPSLCAGEERGPYS